jgi:hypothetical protein
MEEVVDVAAWNHAKNNKFLFSHRSTKENAEKNYAALKGFSGTIVTIDSTIGSKNPEFHEQCPMEIFASTDYSRAKAVQNFMYTQFPNRNSSVSDTIESRHLNSLRMNYIGETQKDGNKLSFYQRGTMMGGNTAATKVNVYCNEIWFKDDIVSGAMALQLALPEISANTEGQGAISNVLQDSIDRAENNGTISVGKPFDNAQKEYVSRVTGDKLAWHQVQSIGSWRQVLINSVVGEDGTTEFEAKFLILYSKDDVINKIEGSNSLI